MQSKRDQVEAHVFMMSRLTSGMLLTDPDAAESPMGRTSRGAAWGLLLGALGTAGCVLFGVLSPGGDDSWKSADAVIVRKDTGTRYIYQDGVLHPIRNYASARLIGGSDLATRMVSAASLDGTPRGVPVGIPGAPDDLPLASDVNSGPWLVCSGLYAPKGGKESVTTALVVGSEPPAGDGLTSGQALLVSAGAERFLVWHGRRLPLDTGHGAERALGYGDTKAREVSAEFLNGLPLGPELAPVDVPGRGTAGPTLDGRATRVGQVFTVQVPDGPRRYYLLTREGLRPLDATRAALVLGDPRTREDGYGGKPPQPEALATDTLDAHLAPAAGEDADASLWPSGPPRLVEPAQGEDLCVSVRPARRGPVTSVAVVSALHASPAVAPDGVQAACAPVDAIAVRPGAGAVVRALGAGGAVLGDTTYLVTDAGVKYRVPSGGAVAALGYGGTEPSALPAPLLRMLPTGPDLDPGAASGATAVRTTPPGGCSDGTAGQGRGPRGSRGSRGNRPAPRPSRSTDPPRPPSPPNSPHAIHTVSIRQLPRERGIP
ncbi:type VII secretion protein EccB [Streptomyces humidus]|uniref:Type VII secretion protein EccB n=1 Tax=Streptomyces humidus TaxID=52259 RepID=A0A918L2G4_9ACTN|nr:type VII secretion protein EccB [Streptomyces humidus]GGR83579.1 type VII secretion protein EccB [Streptomyces humidus]